MGRPWIKLSTGIFDDEKIKLIELLPEGDSLLIIWLKLLCFAGKTDNDGVFRLTEKIPYNEEMLAGIFGRKLTTVRTALKVFQDYGMLEIIDGAYALSNWVKYQNESDAISKSKEKNRIRQKKWYDKHKKPLLEATSQKPNVRSNDSNVSLTPTEEEVEVEEDKDIYSSSCSSTKQQKVKDGHSAVSDFYIHNVRPTPSEYELNCLLDLADEYSDKWTIEALKETIKGGGRGLRYTEKILERWKAEGYKSRPGGKKRSGPSTQSQETIDQANEIPF